MTAKYGDQYVPTVFRHRGEGVAPFNGDNPRSFSNVGKYVPTEAAPAYVHVAIKESKMFLGKPALSPAAVVAACGLALAVVGAECGAAVAGGASTAWAEGQFTRIANLMGDPREAVTLPDVFGGAADFDAQAQYHWDALAAALPAGTEVRMELLAAWDAFIVASYADA